MAKPSDFYVGILTFFAILLPGAVAAAILMELVPYDVFRAVISLPQNQAASWIAFLIAAFFLGHLVFLAGSYVDLLYNYIRERRDPYTSESAFTCAMRIRDTMVEEAERKALNTFQWSRAILTTQFPGAAVDIHMLEADSKFFRSFLVVLVVMAVVLFYRGRWIPGLLVVALSLPCFARYYERRLKATTQAYIYVVTMHRLGKLHAGTD